MATKKFGIVLDLTTQGVPKATQQYKDFLNTLRSAYAMLRGLNKRQKSTFYEHLNTLRSGGVIGNGATATKIAKLARTIESATNRSIGASVSRYIKGSGVKSNVNDLISQYKSTKNSLIASAMTSASTGMSLKGMRSARSRMLARRAARDAAFTNFAKNMIPKPVAVANTTAQHLTPSVRGSYTSFRLQPMKLNLHDKLMPLVVGVSLVFRKYGETIKNVLGQVGKGLASALSLAGKGWLGAVRLSGKVMMGAMRLAGKAFVTSIAAAVATTALSRVLISAVTGKSNRELMDESVRLEQRRISASSMIGGDPTLNALGALREYSSSTGAALEPLVNSFQEALKYSHDTPAILEFQRLMDRFARFTNRDLPTVMNSMMQLVSTGDVGRVSVTLGVPQTALINSKIEEAVESQDFNKINIAMNKIANAAGITEKAFEEYIKSSVNQIERLKIATQNLFTDFYRYTTSVLGEALRPLNDLLSSNAAQQLVSSASILLSAGVDAITKVMGGIFSIEGGIDGAVNKLQTFLYRMDTIIQPILAGVEYAASQIFGIVGGLFDFNSAATETVDQLKERAFALTNKIFGFIDGLKGFFGFIFNLPTTVENIKKTVGDSFNTVKLIMSGIGRTVVDILNAVLSFIGRLGPDMEDMADSFKERGISGVAYKVSDVSRPEFTGVTRRSMGDVETSSNTRWLELSDYLAKSMGKSSYWALGEEQKEAAHALLDLYKSKAALLDPVAAVSEKGDYALYSKNISQVAFELAQTAKYSDKVLAALAAVPEGGLGTVGNMVGADAIYFNKDIAKGGKQESIMKELEGVLTSIFASREQAMELNMVKSLVASEIVKAVTEASGGKYTSMEQLNTRDPEMLAIAKRSRELFENVFKPSILAKITAQGINSSKAVALFDKVKNLLSDRERFFALPQISERRPIPVKPVGAVEIAKEDLVMLAELAQREYVSNFNAQIYAPAPINNYNVQSNADNLASIAREVRDLDMRTPQSFNPNYGSLNREPEVVAVGGR